MTQIEPSLALESLQRFVEAQDSGLYATAIKELQQGEKRSHWMWFIFPQIDGIGYSATARRYAIRNLAEARQYLSHPVLGPRLTICMTTALSIQGRTAFQIFGSPDDMKLHACATLFAVASDHKTIFDEVLEKYFTGKKHEKTMNIIQTTVNPRS